MADKAVLPSDLYQDNETPGYNPGQQGVFGLHPLMTPKYARNEGLRDAEFKETLARMYVSLADADQKTKSLYLKSLPKDDRVQALAKVLIGSGAGSGGGAGFIDFFLSQAQESFNEKLQVDEVLGDNYVAFYFGQAPPIFSYSGMLLNSQQDDQVTGFALAYQHLLRGTSLARRGALLRLRYNGVIVSGTVNSMTAALGAENELAVPFSFTLLVKEYVILRQPAYVKVSEENFVKLSTQFDPEGILKQIGKSQNARVRTTLLTPNVLAQESVAGAEEVEGIPADDTQSPPEQLQSKIDEASQPTSTTSNIRGTLAAETANQSLVPPDQLASFPE